MEKKEIMYTVNVYVVTYNNAQRLNENAKTFFDTTGHLNQYKFNYHVINNHPNFSIRPEFEAHTTVFHNSMRPAASCGHLSRDYNAAIVHGFENLNAPKADQVICCHDDIHWNEGWFERLLEIHDTYTFYAGDYGCSMTSYLPEGVKKIGLWDERFVGLGYHEADMYLRARIYNREKSTINDYFGGRVLNPTTDTLFSQPPTNANKQEHMDNSIHYHTVSRRVFEAKWGVHPEQWDARLTEEPTKPLIPGFLYYSWFELDVETLDKQGYIYQPKGLDHFKEEWK
jgi:hypothetical protein